MSSSNPASSDNTTPTGTTTTTTTSSSFDLKTGETRVGQYVCNGELAVGRVTTDNKLERNLSVTDISSGDSICSLHETATRAEADAAKRKALMDRQQQAQQPAQKTQSETTTGGTAASSNASGGGSGGAAPTDNATAAKAALGSFESQLQDILGAMGTGGKEAEIHGFVCRGITPVGVFKNGKIDSGLTADDLKRGATFCRGNALDMGMSSSSSSSSPSAMGTSTAGSTGTSNAGGASSSGSSGSAGAPAPSRPALCPPCPVCPGPSGPGMTTNTSTNVPASTSPTVEGPRDFTVAGCSGNLMRVDVQGFEKNPCIFKLCDAGDSDVGIAYDSGGQEALCKAIGASAVIGQNAIQCANNNLADIKPC